MKWSWQRAQAGPIEQTAMEILVEVFDALPGEVVSIISICPIRGVIFPEIHILIITI